MVRRAPLTLNYYVFDILASSFTAFCMVNYKRRKNRDFYGKILLNRNAVV